MIANLQLPTSINFLEGETVYLLECDRKQSQFYESDIPDKIVDIEQVNLALVLLEEQEDELNSTSTLMLNNLKSFLTDAGVGHVVMEHRDVAQQPPITTNSIYFSQAAPALPLYLRQGKLERREERNYLWVPPLRHLAEDKEWKKNTISTVEGDVRYELAQRELVFATSNQHKVEEVASHLPAYIKLLSLEDIGYSQPIPETGPTLVQNAINKAYFIHREDGRDVFADDTGLEVHTLNGAPGVNSARYAGPAASSEDNIEKLLDALGNSDDRRATFITVIALYWNGKLFQFLGEVEGYITRERKGSMGFGYDSVFRPEGMDRTYAEMPPREKQKVSHRAAALQKMILFFEKQKFTTSWKPPTDQRLLASIENGEENLQILPSTDS